MEDTKSLTSSETDTFHQEECIVLDAPVVTQEAMDRDMTEDPSREVRQVAVSAGLFTGLVGCLLCGPIGGCLMGVGAAVGAQREESKAGDVARALGRLALSGVQCGTDHLAALDDQHQVSRKFRENTPAVVHRAAATLVQHPRSVAQSTWARVTLADEEYKISHRSWKGVETTLNAMQRFFTVKHQKNSQDDSFHTDSSSSTEEFSIGEDEHDEEGEGGPEMENNDEGRHTKKKGDYFSIAGAEAVTE